MLILFSVSGDAPRTDNIDDINYSDHEEMVDGIIDTLNTKSKLNKSRTQSIPTLTCNI